MNTPQNPKRGGALTATAKVLIIAAALAATVGGWAAMSAPAVSATSTTAAAAQTSSRSNGLLATLAQLLSPAPSSVPAQPFIRTRSSR